MNVLVVLIDSLNRHELACYADGAEAHTPNLDRLAARAWRFDNHFVGSLPCMPARRELLAGRKEMTWRAWGPLETYDHRLPALLRDAGMVTGIVTDHYHYWHESGNGYLQAFDSTTLVRGHERDAWRPPLPAGGRVPRWVRNIERDRPGEGLRYFANVRDFGGEEDFFPARVMTAACDWLDERPTDRPFYLQVESFDVHEPFHVPEPYASMYGPAPDDVDFTLWPPYQHRDELRAFMAAAEPAALDFVRSQYLGKLTMVDRWLGSLLDALDRHDLWDDTAVVLTTDHGHDLGGRGAFGKQFPHCDSHARIPLLVWDPRSPGRGRSVSGLTQTVDLFASLLELGGAAPVVTVSESFVPLLRDGGAGRPALLYGAFGTGACATDGEWRILKAPVAGGELYTYSSTLYDSAVGANTGPPVDHGHFIPGVPVPQWKVPFEVRHNQAAALEDVLVHADDDPVRPVNRWSREPVVRARMLELLEQLVEHEGAPPEQWARLGLRRP